MTTFENSWDIHTGESWLENSLRRLEEGLTG